MFLNINISSRHDILIAKINIIFSATVWQSVRNCKALLKSLRGKAKVYMQINMEVRFEHVNVTTSLRLALSEIRRLIKEAHPTHFKKIQLTVCLFVSRVNEIHALQILTNPQRIRSTLFRQPPLCGRLVLMHFRQTIV